MHQRQAAPMRTWSPGQHPGHPNIGINHSAKLESLRVHWPCKVYARLPYMCCLRSCTIMRMCKETKTSNRMKTGAGLSGRTSCIMLTSDRSSSVSVNSSPARSGTSRRVNTASGGLLRLSSAVDRMSWCSSGSVCEREPSSGTTWKRKMILDSQPGV